MRRIWMLAFLAVACGGSDSKSPPVVDHFGDVTVTHDPLAIIIGDLEVDEITHWVNDDLSQPPLIYGWDYYKGEDEAKKKVTRIESAEQTADKLVLHADGGVTITFTNENGGLHVRATSADAKENRLSIAFKMKDDDHFLGFGERFVHSDQRGRKLTTWVEDGGFGHGEDTPTGPNNPSPSGEGQTNIPIPWLVSPMRGFGMLQNTTRRTTYHLGDEDPAKWRIEQAENAFDLTMWKGDPRALVERLTSVTGRPPPTPDWLFAPRRRGNVGSDEMQKLRDAHVPTTAIDTALHYFPGGIGTVDAKAVTQDIHNRGFKAIAYFCSFIRKTWHPVFDDAVAKGYLVKKPDGSPYVVGAPTEDSGMVDFTNPEATKWYQGFMQQAVDDGWDGWMYDFAEYVPQDAVMFNGMTGFEAHNLYPVLYQKAAVELLDRAKGPGNYLIFVRSGYTGTGGVVPMVWGGDQNTDFSLSDGLPAALTGALNAGLSGIPYWGSDISGYHFIFNPPPDKELYIRWSEVGAFSTEMHDENVGESGTGGQNDADKRWQIWKDAETLDVYKKLSSLKTRMIPYVRVAVDEARANGMPVMRHLALDFPKDPRVLDLSDEYMYGPTLLVAPVVHRGMVNRTVYLPGEAYYDFFTGAFMGGKKDVVVDAPLDSVPVFAAAGAIVPMLASDVETVVDDPDKSAVALADRANILEVQAFVGKDSTITLADGSVLTLHGTGPNAASPSNLADATGALAAGDLATCARCGAIDPAKRTIEASVDGARDLALNAGDVTFAVTNSPVVKRYRVTVHY